MNAGELHMQMTWALSEDRMKGKREIKEEKESGREQRRNELLGLSSGGGKRKEFGAKEANLFLSKEKNEDGSEENEAISTTPLKSARAGAAEVTDYLSKSLSFISPRGPFQPSSGSSPYSSSSSTSFISSSSSSTSTSTSNNSIVAGITDTLSATYRSPLRSLLLHNTSLDSICELSLEPNDGMLLSQPGTQLEDKEKEKQRIQQGADALESPFNQNVLMSQQLLATTGSSLPFSGTTTSSSVTLSVRSNVDAFGNRSFGAEEGNEMGKMGCYNNNNINNINNSNRMQRNVKVVYANHAESKGIVGMEEFRTLLMLKIRRLIGQNEKRNQNGSKDNENPNSSAEILQKTEKDKKKNELNENEVRIWKAIRDVACNVFEEIEESVGRVSSTEEFGSQFKNESKGEQAKGEEEGTAKLFGGAEEGKWRKMSLEEEEETLSVPSHILSLLKQKALGSRYSGCSVHQPASITSVLPVRLNTTLTVSAFRSLSTSSQQPPFASSPLPAPLSMTLPSQQIIAANTSAIGKYNHPLSSLSALSTPFLSHTSPATDNLPSIAQRNYSHKTASSASQISSLRHKVSVEMAERVGEKHVLCGMDVITLYGVKNNRSKNANGASSSNYNSKDKSAIELKQDIQQTNVKRKFEGGDEMWPMPSNKKTQRSLFDGNSRAESGIARNEILISTKRFRNYLTSQINEVGSRFADQQQQQALCFSLGVTGLLGETRAFSMKEMSSAGNERTEKCENREKKQMSRGIHLPQVLIGKARESLAELIVKGRRKKEMAEGKEDKEGKGEDEDYDKDDYDVWGTEDRTEKRTSTFGEEVAEVVEELCREDEGGEGENEKDIALDEVLSQECKREWGEWWSECVDERGCVPEGGSYTSLITLFCETKVKTLLDSVLDEVFDEQNTI
eukprot:MONOS_7256.1-p1 / transcript=MONOS_7256.1 / gene=MONOS_7256 / organism=Monocercomonoides_exilis_PA203 / gene_product=unspecified product / transcript_product=unspecified product / location=Mono_scaffold00244:1309-4020(-) / protein_length=904 / sequence_SO=supercontig / SO=protein_coding / is_pseudo=false